MRARPVRQNSCRCGVIRTRRRVHGRSRRNVTPNGNHYEFGSMKISVELPVAQPEAIQTCALAIEDAGFDACFVTDHPAPSREWLAGGGHQTLDPFVALS